MYIARPVTERLRGTDRQDVLIIGDAGSGKPAIAQDLAIFRSTNEDVVVLRAADLAGVNRLQTQAPVQEVLRARTGPPELLVVDGVDALRGSEDRETLSGIVNALINSRWQVVATARTFDARHSHPLSTRSIGRVAGAQARRPRLRRHRRASRTGRIMNGSVRTPGTYCRQLVIRICPVTRLRETPLTARASARPSPGSTGGSHEPVHTARTEYALRRTAGCALTQGSWPNRTGQDCPETVSAPTYGWVIRSRANGRGSERHGREHS